MTTPQAPYLYAGTWWCGDDVCDCTQPQIEIILSDPPWPKREMLWEGSFRCDREPAEKLEDDRELASACERFGIPWAADTIDTWLAVTTNEAATICAKPRHTGQG